MAGRAMELEIKVLELTELQVHYKKCICKNVQLAEQKMKLERRVHHLESNMYICPRVPGATVKPGSAQSGTPE